MLNIDDVSAWFDQGVKNKYIFLVVKYSKVKEEYFPSFCGTREEAILDAKYVSDTDSAEAIYDLRQDKFDQLLEYKCWRV